MKWLFQYGRIEGFPTIYNTPKTSVTVDIVEVIIFFVITTIGVTYLLIIPGYGKKKSIYIIVKSVLSILIAGSIMVANFGQEWEVGEIQSIKTPYRAGEKSEIKAEIGIKIGLRSVNITLKGHGDKDSPLASEIINYNERFSWTWDQGRFGFGPNAGHLQMNLREAQIRGLPLPIIWVLDYFAIDGEGLRFGRFYRTAGWYCHILLWSAVPAWILANIFLQSVGRYAAYFTGLIGFLKISSCVIWVVIRNPSALIIPFQDKIISTSFGWTFWLTCVGGIFCLLLASVLIIMDLRYPIALSTFLGIDILDQYDEYVIRANDLDNMRNKSSKDDSMELGKMSELFPKDDSGVVLLKRRSTVKRAQKNLLRVSSVPIKIYNYDEDTALYENQPVPGSSFQNSDQVKFRPIVPRRN